MKFAKYACAFAFACSAAFQPAAAQDQYKAQIEALRKAMEKYKDYKVAVRDLYLSTVGCVHYAGEKSPITWCTPRGHGSSLRQSDGQGPA